MAREAFGFARSKRVGDDLEAINRMFAPEFRNRLDSIVQFGRLPREVISKVVDKFIMQLEAQLGDRGVGIELSDEARGWLIENGYDEAMGARPMARVIQQHIKTPLADEVLFGRLKNGGTVRVVVGEDEKGKKKLAFVYPEGPALPKPDKEVIEASKIKKPPKDEPEVRRAKTGKKGKGGEPPAADGEDPKGGIVPRVPLKG